MARPADSMIIGPLSHAFGSRESSCIRNSAVWNTMTVGKALCQWLNGGFGRNITCRKGESITRISICSSKDKAFLSFPQRKWYNVLNLPPARCLVILGNGTISEAQCWSQQIWHSAAAATKLALVSGSPCFPAHIYPHLCHQGHSVCGSIGQ